MSNYERSELLEKQFKKRYNRDVKVFLKKDEDGNQLTAKIKIISPKGKEYILTDIMDEGRTVAAWIKFEKEVKDPQTGKTVKRAIPHKYTNYLLAEIMCADQIGEEEEIGNNH